MRWLAALLTALLLAGAYKTYNYCVLPLVEMNGDAIAPPLEGASEFQPPVFKKVAEQYFAEYPWTSQAAIKWQRGEDAFLFAETAEPEETQDGKILRCAPLAILWRDPKHPEADPYRIIAQEGRLQFENSFFDEAFDLTQVNPGRIIGASLDGSVIIYGPDGLQIRGRDFTFSEANGELTSYYPVQFAHGPIGEKRSRIKGSGDGLNIRFITSGDAPLGKDLPHVAGVSSINLRQNVRFDFDEIIDDKPVKAVITCKGPFEYEFASRRGTFENDVRVTQTKLSKSGDPLADRIVCYVLGLLFEKDPDRPSTKPPVDEDDPQLPDINGLRLRKVHALGLAPSRNAPGSKVIIESQGQKILGNLSDLRYDPVDRVAELRDDKHVIVQRGETRFGSPYIRLVHSADNELELLECKGAGQLAHVHPQFADGPVEAHWDKRLDVRPDETGRLQVVQLQGATRLSIPKSLAVAADEMTLWLDAEQLQQLQIEAEGNQRSDFLKQPLPFQQAEARGHVFVVGQELIVGSPAANRDGGAKHLLIVMTPGAVPEKSGNGLVRTGADDNQQSAGEPLYVESDELKVTIAHDVAHGRLGVQQVEGEGHVRLEQHSSETIRVGSLESERQLTVTAVSFVAYNKGADQQIVNLIGQTAANGDVTQPAKVEVGPFTIEGGLLTLDRSSNIATVEGPGRITFPVPVGLSGEKLGRPADMMVVWREKMVFDGQRATFHGAVQASVQNDAENISRVECEEIVVELLNPVDFRATPGKSRPAELKSMLCRHNVRIDAFAYAGKTLVGRRHAELASFSVDRVSGNFVGQGPGLLDLWSFGNSVRIARQAAPVANRPAQSEGPGWRYTNVLFRGQMTGNINEERAELNEDVEIVSAPVAKHSQTFRRHGLSQATDQAGNAAWIGCDRLTMSYPLNPGTKRRSATLLATGSTELESQQFHATADEIKFEELQGRFTLRGHGQDALLHSQKVPGDPWDTTSNRLIEFTPSIPRISVDGSTGINGGL